MIDSDYDTPMHPGVSAADSSSESRDDEAPRDAQIRELEELLQEERRRLEAVLGSTSWRVTTPLRFVGRVLRGTVRLGRRVSRRLRRAMASPETRSGVAREGLKAAAAHALEASHAGDWAESVSRWSGIIGGFDGSAPPRAFAWLSKSHRNTGNIEGAVAAITEGQRRFADSPTILVEAAEVAMARRDWPQAVELWRAVLAGIGSEPKPYFDRRAATSSVGLAFEDPQAALSTIRELRTHRPATDLYWAAEGIALLRCGDFDRARDHWMLYWQLSAHDDAFHSSGRLTIPSDRSASERFPVAALDRDSSPDLFARMRVCVYTALFGEYDDLRDPLWAPPGIDFVCFSDRPRDVEVWDVRVVAPESDDPILENRRYKVRPHVHLPEYDASLYIDANVLVVGDLEQLIRSRLVGSDFAAFRHPERSDVYEECEAILTYRRYEPNAIIGQYQFLQNEGVPSSIGLLEGSVLWRSHRDESVISLMDAWWNLLVAHGPRDQPLLAYSLWTAGARPHVISGSAIENDFFLKRPHNLVPAQVQRAVSRSSDPAPPASSLMAEEADSGESAVEPSGRAPSRYGVVRSHIRPVVWVYRTGAVRASTHMRGEQLIAILGRYLGTEIDMRWVSDTEIFDQAGATVIMTKSFLEGVTDGEVDLLRQRGHILCADFVDLEVRSDLRDYIDVYITSSIRQHRRLTSEARDRPVHLITHNTDPAIEGVSAQGKEPRIGYFGEVANAQFLIELAADVAVFPVDTGVAPKRSRAWVDALPEHSVHYAVRRSRPGDGFKPFTKGFTAAACGANVIVQLNESDARYYLGADYPYVLEDDSLASVRAMIDSVRESFGGPEWRFGLEIMASVRRRSSPEYIAREFSELLRLVG